VEALAVTLVQQIIGVFQAEQQVLVKQDFQVQVPQVALIMLLLVELVLMAVMVFQVVVQVWQLALVLQRKLAATVEVV
jgi:hypothetical protein